jgi:uncharacterized repeat protein (TIGR03803 family)
MYRSAISHLQYVASFSIALLVLAMVVMPAAQAQTGQILHSFRGGPSDGSSPEGLIAVDSAGNVYGSTPFGGNGGGPCAPLDGCGMVFRALNRNGSFIYTPLYLFHGGNDGGQPLAGVTLGPDGTVYGTTLFGGGNGCGGNGCGTVFRLTPPPTFCRMVLCGWDETVIYRYTGGSGPFNFFGGVVVDAGGNVYGASFNGGNFGGGAVYKLSPAGGGNYTETTLYSFTGAHDGAEPAGDLAMDAAGNIYGTAEYGGPDGFGTVFKLVREAEGYSFQLLYAFTNGADGNSPQGSVVLDSAGNLYGTSGNGGGVFQITPSGVYSLIDPILGGLQAPISIDSAGNIYSTTYGGGQNDDGSVFEDTYSSGTWTHHVIFSFGGGFGGLPLSDVGFDSSGNMYVTSTFGGQGGAQGTLVQITP